MTDLLIQKHVKYFKISLNILPSRLQREDSNKLMLIYCCIGGLSLLKYNFTDQERQEIVQFVYSHYLPSGEGFRGSMTHRLPSTTRYDPPTVANTYCALCILLMLGEDYTGKIDREAVMGYVKKCQEQDGSFRSLVDINELPFGDGDLRQTYMACCIRRMLHYDGGENDIDIDSLEKNVLGQVTYNGGLGTCESHAGYTFCGLVSLKLIGKLDAKSAKWEKTIDWLAHRQIDYNEYNKEVLSYEFADETDKGSFNGRDNKFGDTCYAFWCAGSLKVFDKESFINGSKLENYLLNVTQNSIMGGFSKTDADDPDPYHSFLGLAALTIVDSEIGSSFLEPIDSTLTISKTASKFLNTLYK